jgi:DNA repair protein RadC
MASVYPAALIAPRRKLHKCGVSSLSEAELLTLMLQRGRDPAPALDL